MARCFVAAHPPASPLMMFYGDSFPDFIASFEAGRDIAYLIDVARLEAARTRAYHAQDATPLAPAVLQSVAADDLGHMRFLLHPSVEIVSSPHPIVTILAMNEGSIALGPIADWQGEDALVARPFLDVEIRALPPGRSTVSAQPRQAAGGSARLPCAPCKRRKFRPCRQSRRAVQRRTSHCLFDCLTKGPASMSDLSVSSVKPVSGPAAWIGAIIHLMDLIPQSFISLCARIFPAAVFWLSGETKVDGFHLKDSAVALFREEYALPLIDPTIAATMAAFAEHFFPVLLVIGFASRFAALALLGMTAVIEIFVYPMPGRCMASGQPAFSSSSRAGRGSCRSTTSSRAISAWRSKAKNYPFCLLCRRRSQSSACRTMVGRSSYWGVQPSVARMRSAPATSAAGSPGRLAASRTSKSAPETFLTTSITSKTERPWP